MTCVRITYLQVVPGLLPQGTTLAYALEPDLETGSVNLRVTASTEVQIVNVLGIDYGELFSDSYPRITHDYHSPVTHPSLTHVTITFPGMQGFPASSFCLETDLLKPFLKSSASARLLQLLYYCFNYSIIPSIALLLLLKDKHSLVPLSIIL